MNKVIKKDHINRDALGSQTRPVQSGPVVHRARGIKEIRLGGIVRGLEITCRCGETLLVELEYDHQPSSEEAA